ncbi:MAG: DUF1540 domain-containing protein [Clostridiales bacterium]|nr:DUF1540 domain-containing protein [Clostridiales bacterium]
MKKVSENAPQDIFCSAVKCRYNENGTKCIAEKIAVGNAYATRPSDTQCETYTDK